jgi:hypothetical protein
MQGETVVLQTSLGGIDVPFSKGLFWWLNELDRQLALVASDNYLDRLTTIILTG